MAPVNFIWESECLTFMKIWPSAMGPAVAGHGHGYKQGVFWGFMALNRGMDVNVQSAALSAPKCSK